MNRKTMGVALLSAAVATAMAQDAQAQESKDWMMGVGVSLDLWGLAGAAGASSNAGALGGVGGFGLGPMYVTGLERRISGPLWFTVRAGASLSGSEGSGSFPSVGESYALNGQLGLRYVLNQDDPVRVSVRAALEGDYGKSSHDFTTTDAEGDALAVEQRARRMGGYVNGGLVLDYWPTDIVALRLDTQVLTAGVRSSTWSDEGARDEELSWFGQLTLSPTFSVQLAF